jgi:hypothetical protein
VFCCKNIVMSMKFVLKCGVQDEALLFAYGTLVQNRIDAKLSCCLVAWCEADWNWISLV